MQHAITLLFNVEDLCWPGSDDIAKELAVRLTQRGLRATFLIVGEKARLLMDRNRFDVIEALADHDLGSHTARHSIHPTTAEYLADLDWDDGVLTAWDEEDRGLDMLQTAFGMKPSTLAQAGGSWGPQLHAAMQRAQVSAMVYPQTRLQDSIDIHWYADQLVFPKGAIFSFDAVLTDKALFEHALDDFLTMLDERIMLGLRWTGILVCRPTHLRTAASWDVLNYAGGINTTPERYRLPELRNKAVYHTALENFDRLLDRLQTDSRLDIRTIADLKRDFTPPESLIYLSELDDAVTTVRSQTDIPTQFYQFSAAELLDILVRLYAEDGSINDSIQRRTVLGPTEDPPPFDPDDQFVYWSDFLVACRMIVDHVTRYGRLPASVYLNGAQWSLGAFYRAAVDAWADFRQGTPPRYIEWRPAPLYPSIGHEIAVNVQEAYAAWPIHQPDLDLNKLLMHTCFQCWTLRPAYPHA